MEPDNEVIDETIPQNDLNTIKRTYNDYNKLGNQFFQTDFWSTFYSQDLYQIYISEYKYASDFEGRPEFINDNAVDGFLQNIDSKHIFGSLVLVTDKEEHKRLIGFWILDGNVTPSEETFNNFFEFNDWKKTDMTSDIIKFSSDLFNDQLSEFSDFKKGPSVASLPALLSNPATEGLKGQGTAPHFKVNYRVIFL